MTSFEWKGAFDLGHEEIDAQHRQMFRLAEAVTESLGNYGSNRVEVSTAHLQALVDFTEEHFAFEEALMRSTSYPEADWHAKHHASLLSELRAYCRKAQRGQITNALSMVSFLWNWLHLHIDSVDRELVLWLGQPL